MASYNAHRLDVLDYLIPPVKKSHGAFRTEILFSRNFQRKTDVRLIKDIRKKITRGIICPPVVSHPQDVQASASVILKKTTEELIHKQYSFLNSRDKNCKTTTYLPINKRRDKDPADKPMIKVTIIPKQTDTPMKVFNKRRERTKELQNSVSNLENSVQNNNYYYMVKGKRREKVYEIKTSESTNFSNNSFNAKYDDISLQQITSSKRLINSLNMEKKKRKTKKAVPSNTTFDVIEGTQSVENFAESKPVNAHKSKVTIVGQLGLNRDDQYILKCAATVNDKPSYPRNSNTQTDFRYTNNGNILNDSYYKAQSIDYKNKTVQCRCGIPPSEKNIFNIREQEYAIKNGKMPLVVISVYPKHGDENNIISVKNTHQPTTSQKQVNNMDNNISFKGRKKQQTNDGVLSAPVKHYRDDECSILDPNERDKEIRALLGIVRNTGKPNNDDYIATKGYIKDSKSLVTGISVSRSAKITMRGKKVKTQTISNVAESDNAIGIEGTGFQATQQKKKCSPVKSLSDKLLEQMFNNKVYKDDQQIIEKPENDNFTNIDLHSKPNYNKYAKNKKFVLNRNIKVYLQIGESNRERYIALNRTQYEKVKRTIQCSSKHHKCSFNNYNVVSIGEIRIKRPQKASYDREVQTERSEIDRTCKQTQYNYKTQITNKHYTKQTEPGDRNIEKIIYTADTSNDNKVRKDLSERKVKPQAVTRRTVSSVDVCLTNGSKKKHMPISSTCFGDGVHDNIPHNSPHKPKHSPSIYTIFKILGHKKCNSPNLGASAYSLSSEANESMKYFEVNQQPCAGDCKPSKPFFRRLLSCLVMRTPETTGFIEVQKQKVSIVNSSVDAYHLSTSLGAMEMSSSLYDTSVSFYSNHSVPTNKMKRGFFSSVWGLFSVRRN
ncbi:uncharacterized protein LOC112048426 [Bicyclus anynana]|uniref:Uncharacterized protein LOC112048426 n=1 Tax=Bicyclus anynana TaxID=110368 RepID=A0ABM3LID4_BICAN|nr:uncharacterized protein LOC112048426 [Bicyclus anynana]